MSSQNSNHPLLCSQSPWKGNSNSIWLGSTLTLNRNVEKFKFPGKLSIDKRKQIIALLAHSLLANEQLRQPQLIKAEDMSPVEKEFLVEHFLANADFHQAYTGEAFILDETAEFLAVLNLRDHLMLQWIDPREELEGAWDRLVKLENELNKTVNFAFSPKFGFLTSDPTQCGTAFIVYIFLHLPGLIYTDRLDEAIKKNKDEGIELTGLQGDPSEIIGDIVAFHNNYTLGLTEETILSSMRSLATKLVVEEKSARTYLKQEHSSEMSTLKDKVSRAYAILLHSYQLEAIEALQALSLLKLGLELEWLTGVSQETLNELFFNCRRAHLLCHFKEKISQENIPHKRSEFIHQALKGVSLLI
ncbi:protein arginine kinase [Candidatus Protochlamydia phocaeensis]|uniref:protein arginine kinase n=1 Tax=Candidatus Protochlamydia phocaeensis TaxID=1414722 RepID=UPI00083959B1|nr:protein arginine kinase [Candidatus Protochlamydia phocaeensis]